ncbi:MAG: glycosyltransferase family 4 protein [Thermoleophilaceae bacterium]|nr:glycosyltransferase family 4 protein [Thermoleophilaceae bacterium]
MRAVVALFTLRPGQVGGSETFARGLLRGLAETRREGERIVAAAGPVTARSLAEDVRGRLEVAALPGWREADGRLGQLAAMTRGRLAGGRLRSAIAAAAGGLPDVVHYPLTVATPRPGAPSVVTVHDLQHELMPELFSPLERAYRRAFYTTSIRSAAAIATISEYSRRTILERHPVDPERVFVCLAGVDRRRFSPQPGARDEELLAPLDLPERFLYYPANLWPHKNHERLLAGLAQAEDREVAIVLSGQTWDRLAPLVREAERLGVAGRVRHVGFVARDALAPLYRRAHGLIFPSLFEGFGNPTLEALACGTPVAASDAASLPEVLAGAGHLFDPTDPAAIAAAIDLLAAGSGRVEPPPEEFWRRYTWERVAEATREAYAAAAALGPGAA